MAMEKRKSRLATAKQLAESHISSDPGVQRVFLLKGDSEQAAKEPIKLLEIVEDTLEVGIEPIGFPGSNRTGGWPVVVVDVSPNEYSKFARRKSIRFNGTVWKIAEELAHR
jgi:hypothetical protein